MTSASVTPETDQLDQILLTLREKVPGYPFELALITRLSGLLEKRMTEILNEALRPLQLSAVLYHAMMIMYGSKNGIIAPSTIADLTGERPNNVTHICNHLEAAGYITRSHAAKDRRRLNVSLTAAGRRILGKAQPLVWEAWNRRFKNFSRSELDLLPQLMRRQMANLQAIPPAETD